MAQTVSPTWNRVAGAVGVFDMMRPVRLRLVSWAEMPVSVALGGLVGVGWVWGSWMICWARGTTLAVEVKGKGGWKKGDGEVMQSRREGESETGRRSADVSRNAGAELQRRIQ